MSLILMLGLQTAAVATPAASAAPPASAPRRAMPAGQAGITPLAFDLARLRTEGGCGAGDAADVLVCGRRRSGGAYPMAHWARIFGPEPPIRAEMDLGHGVQGRVYTEQVGLDRGAVANRILVGIRTRF